MSSYPTTDTSSGTRTPGGPQGVQRTDRDRVGQAEHCLGQLVGLQPMGQGRRTTARIPLRLDDQLGSCGTRGGRHAPRAGRSSRSRDDSEPSRPSTAIRRCPCRNSTSTSSRDGRHVVHPDVVGDRLVDLTDQHDRRQRDIGLDGTALQPGRIEDQTVDELGPSPGQQPPLAFGLAVGLLDLHRQATALGRPDHEVGDLGGVRGVQVGQGQRDDPASSVAQSAGGEVRDVVQVGDRALDPLSGRRADRNGAVDHVGDGLRRHPGPGGDVTDRSSHGPIMPVTVPRRAFRGAARAESAGARPGTACW